ncbi:kinetochore Sim4 complex subunit FTA2-domain-containing protein [Camillea tinctor]|nr:kinetochore Sim4 complex subunit FTA2-domain-containing protein [Camillea tinctor]
MPKVRVRRATTRHANVLLPPCPGPKLHAFKHADSPIIWGRRLDRDRDDNEGFVFQVEIDSKEYALKVFKFSHPRSNRYYRQTRLEKEIPLSQAIFYTDPFYAECRAYGRIQEGIDSRKVREHTAVKCHGYLYLTGEDERSLRRRGLDFEYQLMDRDLRKALGGDTRVRAIVKQLEKDTRRVDARNIRRAWRSVCLLNESLKIYNMDIRADNFISYRLVDFGSSWTEPHALLQFLEEEDKRLAEDKRLRDTSNFDDMIQEEQIPTRLRVLSTSRHQLRSRGRVG